MERIGAGVERQLARFDGRGAMPRIVAAWPEVVGAEVARNAWPARVARDGTLHVNTSSSVWAFELGQLAPNIVERLRAEIGDAQVRTGTPARACSPAFGGWSAGRARSFRGGCPGSRRAGRRDRRRGAPKKGGKSGFSRPVGPR